MTNDRIYKVDKKLSLIPQSAFVLSEHGEVTIWDRDSLTETDDLFLENTLIYYVLPPDDAGPRHKIEKTPGRIIATPILSSTSSLSTRDGLYIVYNDYHASIKPIHTKDALLHVWEDYIHSKRILIETCISKIRRYKEMGFFSSLKGIANGKDRSLVWKAVWPSHTNRNEEEELEINTENTLYGMFGAPYRLGVEYHHPGAMACAGPFGAAQSSYFRAVSNIIAIAADIRVFPISYICSNGAVMAESGIPIALYRVLNINECEGTIDLKLIQCTTPFNPLDLLPQEDE
ncbi:MAG: hypothetical protein QXQ02_02225 [Halobacteria archaeon]